MCVLHFSVANLTSLVCPLAVATGASGLAAKCVLVFSDISLSGRAYSQFVRFIQEGLHVDVSLFSLELNKIGEDLSFSV